MYGVMINTKGYWELLPKVFESSEEASKYYLSKSIIGGFFRIIEINIASQNMLC